MLYLCAASVLPLCLPCCVCRAGSAVLGLPCFCAASVLPAEIVSKKSIFVGRGLLSQLSSSPCLVSFYWEGGPSCPLAAVF